MISASAAALVTQATSSPASPANSSRNRVVANGRRPMARIGRSAGRKVIVRVSGRREPGLRKGENRGSPGAPKERPIEDFPGKRLAVDDDAARARMGEQAVHLLLAGPRLRRRNLDAIWLAKPAPAQFDALAATLHRLGVARDRIAAGIGLVHRQIGRPTLPLKDAKCRP